MASEVAECHAKPTTPGKLTLEDVMCPICLSILIEPVTMPCRHSLCMPCFNQHVAHSALACPICRRRINVWVRRAAIAKRLVNTRLWQNIQDSFAAKVEARIHGLDDSDSEEINVPVHHVSAPGEIRQEYESLLAQQHQDESIRKTEEELASSKLIQELQENEKMRLRERRKQQELLAENDTVVAQHIKEAEKMLLEEQLKQFQKLCASDEALARQIEEAEQKEQQKQKKQVGRGHLGTNSNKSAIPPRGPMDVYIGQKTPRFYGKLIVPEVPCSSSDNSLMTSDKIKTTAMTSQDFNTPTTSMSRSENSSTSSSKLDTTCIVSNCSSESLDYRVGRELREIISSQSSESEAEDLVSPLQKSNHRRPNTSGKENIQERRNNSPCKLGKGKGTFISSRKTYNQNSPDIDSYNGVIGVKGNCISISKKDENSEEMDIEEFICGQSTTKTKGRENVKVTKRLVNGDHNSKSSVCETDGSDDEQIVTVSEASDIPDSNQSSELNIQTDLTSIFCGQEGSSESLESLIAEQRRLEARLKQEVKDRLLAESLQKQFDQQRRVVNRSRGSEDEYKLRQRTNASRTSHKAPSISAGNSSQKKGRQPTLMESIAKRHKTA